MLETIKGRMHDVRTLTRLLQEAEAVATRAGHEVPGPEHVVVAATMLDDGTAAAALEAVGLDPAQLEVAVRAVEQDTVDAGPAPPAATTYRMTAAGSEFVQRLHAVHADHGGRLRGAMVVLAAAGLEEGTWPRVLVAAGITADELRVAARTHL